jgi:hypothetical protein
MISCMHLDHIRRVTPRTPEGEECLKLGDVLGPPPPVPGTRTHGLLRFLQEQACTEALPPHRSPDRPVVRARGSNWTLRNIPGI